MRACKIFLIVVGTLATCSALFAASAVATPALDTTFGGGVITPKVFPNGKWLQVARAALLQPDGKVVVPMALSAKYGRHAKRPILRYNPDGTLDPSFGKGGIAWIGIPGARYLGFTGASLRPDGSMLVLGVSYRSARARPMAFVAKLSAAGRLVKSFGHRGVTAFSSGREWARELIDVFLLTDGSTLLAFRQGHENDDSLDLVRLRPGGRVDHQYADHGVKSIEIARGELFPEIRDIKITGDEATILVNPDSELGARPCHVIRTKITSSGGLVRSFGKNGMVKIASSLKNSATRCAALAPTADGGVVVVGSVQFDEIDGTSEGTAWKLRADGSRDPSFAGGGVTTARDNDEISEIAPLPDGGFLTVGYRDDPGSSQFGPLGGVATTIGAGGELTELFAGATIPQTSRSYVTSLDHQASGNVALFTRYTIKGEQGSRIVKLTN